jgi:hypothetical protein
MQKATATGGLNILVERKQLWKSRLEDAAALLSLKLCWPNVVTDRPAAKKL